MRQRFDEQLHQLNHELITMGSHIERAIDTAGRLLSTRDLDMAHRLIKDDETVDRMEREIETLCLRMLLTQQPVARDLRLVSAAIKMITDMERIGDQAADIAEIITMPLTGQPLTLPEHLPPMAVATAAMVKRAVDAYVTRDLALARQVMADDDVVDGLFDQVKQDLIGLIGVSCRTAQTDQSMQLLDMLMIAKYFERSADHAVNIAEWVEFAVTGDYKGERLA